MTIRKYRSTDFSEILKIYSLTKLEELRFETEQFSFLPLDVDEKRFKAFTECEVFVYEEVKILGYCAFFGNEIRALFVLPQSQGKGIGKNMLKFMLENISGTPLLNLAASNTPAKKLYESFGFGVTAEFIAEYNGKAVLALEMRQEQIC
ncbi:MAG: N-acetyltransferase [Gammaproteobacteria bacterium]|nr:MAG: N-acetyltransferase [Gammaproteobacteria bacterium]